MKPSEKLLNYLMIVEVDVLMKFVSFDDLNKNRQFYIKQTEYLT